MRRSVFHAFLITAVLAAPASALADDAARIATQGNGKGAPPCQACHGPDGAGQAAAGFPRLAGLNATYLRRQLDDLANGTRSNAVMKPIASALSEDEREQVAHYYSTLPIPPALATPTTPLPPPDSPGAVLALHGRWSQQMPACEQCHGPGGVGVGAAFPPLAGQPASYIEAQLQAWKHGSRHNDPLQLMQHISQSLSEADIVAVATWFAAQPLGRTGDAP